MNFTYFTQRFIYPFTSLNNLKPSFFNDLKISDDNKKYLTNFLILNVFFDDYNDLWKNIGLSYFTIKNYFKSNDDFIVVKDDNRNYYTKAISFINEKFTGLVLKVPLIYPSFDKSLIINTYNDLFSETKILNTAIYLTLKYTKPNIDSLDFDIEIQKDVGFLGD